MSSSGIRRYIIFINSSTKDQGYYTTIGAADENGVTQDGKSESYTKILEDHLNSNNVDHFTGGGNAGFLHPALRLGLALYHVANIGTAVDGSAGDCGGGALRADVSKTDSKWREINDNRSSVVVCDKRDIAKSGSGNDVERSEISRVSVAEILHDLSDLLPDDVGYLVDVVWLIGGDEDRRVIDASDITTVYGALKRITAWHNGHVTIISDENSGFDWVRTLNVTFVTTPDEFRDILRSVRSTLWRGCLNQPGGKVKKPGQPFYLSLVDDNFKSDVHNTETQPMMTSTANRVVLSNNIDIVQVLALSSIPGYLVSPVRMALSASSNVNSDEMSARLPDQLLGNRDSALLLRLQAFHPDTIDPDFRTDSETWKKRVLNPRNCDRLEIRSSGLSDCCYMICFRGGLPDGGLSVVPLYPERLVSGEVALQLARRELFDDHADCHCSEIEDPDEISKRRFQKFVFDKMRKKKLKERAVTGVRFGEFRRILGESKKLVDRLKSNSDPRFEKLRETFLAETDSGVVHDEDHRGDPGLPVCPEARFLLNLESIKSKFSNQKSSDDLLAGIPPPPAGGDKLTLSVSDIMSHFDSYGRASAANLSPIPVKNRSKFLRQQCVKTLSELPFTEAVCTPWHGVDYNNDSLMYTPTKDRKLVLVQRRFVANDTASTFYPGGEVSGNMVILQKENVTQKSVAARSNKPRTRSTTQTRAGKRRRPDDGCRRLSEESPRDEIKISRRVSTRSLTSQSTTTTTTSGSSSSTTPDQGCGVSEPEKTITDSNQLRRSSRDRSAPVANTENKSRSDRHKRRLKIIVDEVLLKAGVDRKHKHYTDCSGKLYRICMLYLKDLKTSKGLNQEMRRTAELNVKQVVEFFTRVG